MAVQGLTITLSTGATATVVAGSRAGTSGAGRGYIRVVLTNRGTGSAYLGDSTTLATGYQLTSGETRELTLGPTDTLYASSTGTAPVLHVIRLGETT